MSLYIDNIEVGLVRFAIIRFTKYLRTGKFAIP